MCCSVPDFIAFMQGLHWAKRWMSSACQIQDKYIDKYILTLTTSTTLHSNHRATRVLPLHPSSTFVQKKYIYIYSVCSTIENQLKPPVHHPCKHFSGVFFYKKNIFHYPIRISQASSHMFPHVFPMFSPHFPAPHHGRWSSSRVWASPAPAPHLPGPVRRRRSWASPGRVAQGPGARSSWPTRRRWTNGSSWSPCPLRPGKKLNCWRRWVGLVWII